MLIEHCNSKSVEMAQMIIDRRMGKKKPHYLVKFYLAVKMNELQMCTFKSFCSTDKIEVIPFYS